mgnify:FL=1|jgi:hypothetical protein
MALSHNQRITSLEASTGSAPASNVAFRVGGGLTTNQLLTVGDVLNFSSVMLCYPPTAFNATTKKFTVPVAGVYQFGYKLYQNSPDNNMRISLNLNGVPVAITGAKGDAAENSTTIIECVVGDVIHVECLFGGGNIFMSSNHSWFYGHLLFKM